MVNYFRYLQLKNPLQAALEAFYPPLCRLCGDSGDSGIDLCLGCQESLPWNSPACPRCAMPAQGQDLPCRCINEPWPFTSATVPLLYEGAVATLVGGFKYHGNLAQGQLLGKILSKALEASEKSLPRHLIPLPLHYRRLRQRGFEQTNELARAISKDNPSIIPTPILNRRRATSQQSLLAASQRHANVYQAFEVNARTLLPKHVALLDDVVTTGATAISAAKALISAGAERVDLWAVARASINS
ncbi:ComF family protein [Halorhodospira halochloris]|uniref:ComF family protein n=1 Tax=Halorhodospira halochloris TaxID=1052 RepID=UPI001EE94409|nr:ComF family protein [Halorhodospira halochloris]MCG5529409.1 ComF family protein [Halorhodospira halochloris]